MDNLNYTTEKQEKQPLSPILHHVFRKKFCFPLYKTGKACYNDLALKNAPVAQWIEHRIPVPRVGGSSPFRRTKEE